MGRFATREDEVDDLFRRGVFVDLYRVVRQGIRAGVESYSIKRLEPLCGYARQVDLRDATAALIAFEAALDDGTAAGERDRQRVVAGYNEDDCRATLVLRDWLEERRVELAARLGQELPRPAAVEEVRCDRRSGACPDQGRAARRCPGRSVGALGRAEREGVARRPARLAPARGQARLVAVLLPPYPRSCRADRRAGRAWRPDRR